MGEPKGRARSKAVASGVAPVVLFGFSLAIVIPPIPSDGEAWSATPAMWMGGIAFAVFLLLSRRPVWLCAGLMAVYLVFVWALHVRVFLG